jgi:hypothetical protein
MRRSIILWILSLALTAGIASVVTAQVNRSTTPEIVTGGDLGFRVEGTDYRTGKPVGRIVIRRNGEWVDVGDVVDARRATSR